MPSQITLPAIMFFCLVLISVAFGAGAVVGEQYRPFGLDRKQNDALQEFRNRLETDEALLKEIKRKTFPDAQ